jgi:hypothetical protein
VKTCALTWVSDCVCLQNPAEKSYLIASDPDFTSIIKVRPSYCSQAAEQLMHTWLLLGLGPLLRSQFGA